MYVHVGELIWKYGTVGKQCQLRAFAGHGGHGGAMEAGDVQEIPEELVGLPRIETDIRAPDTRSPSAPREARPDLLTGSDWKKSRTDPSTRIKGNQPREDICEEPSSPEKRPREIQVDIQHRPDGFGSNRHVDIRHCR